ncbi:hypothetical protein HK101_008764 [Irineochytrium annulatum]|nr:hypothetical protein HK101_008764 [Irineochytrium annulatum]
MLSTASLRSLPTYTLSDLAKHNTESDAWIAVEGKVYNITPFLDAHPGGKRILLTVLGKDATKEFKRHHNSAAVFGKYDKKMVVGLVKGQEDALVDEEVKWPKENKEFGDMVAFGDPAWYQGWKSPYYNDTHARLRSWIRKIVDTELIPFAEQWEAEGSVPPEVYRRFGEIGFLSGITGSKGWPDYAPNEPPCGIKRGEWDAFHELVLGDELNRTGATGINSAITLGPSIALPPVIHFGPPEMQQRVIGPVLRGEKSIALAITEPFAGSDVANITTTAVLDERAGVFVVNGEKKWITNGVWADFFVVAVRTGGKGMGGISLLLVEKGMAGFETRPIKCQGNTGSGTAFLTFENVKVPVGNLIGKHERLGICTSAIRFARVCYEEAMKHANQRRTFGQLLFGHGVIRNKLANMAHRIEAAHAWQEFLIYQLQHANAEEAALKFGGPIALLKAHTTQLVEFCAREASQILGGIAYTRGGKGGVVERIYREVRGFAIPGGSEEIMLDLGIRQALKVSELMGAKL